MAGFQKSIDLSWLFKHLQKFHAVLEVKIKVKFQKKLVEVFQKSFTAHVVRKASICPENMIVLTNMPTLEIIQKEQHFTEMFNVSSPQILLLQPS